MSITNERLDELIRMNFAEYPLDLQFDLDDSLRELKALREKYRSAVSTLQDIAVMGKKQGSEMAKHRLTELNVDWETGGPTQDYGRMT